MKSYPHDRRFFTQGLVYEDGFLYEGTGLYGQSALYKRSLQTGKTVKMLRLPGLFGEGITLFGDKLIELTWQSHIGFVYRKDTLAPLGRFKYSTEGWGLTHDDKRLILSDGTATLHFLDPNTYVETGRIEVRDQGRPVDRLNELEFINSSVYANICTAIGSRSSIPRTAALPAGSTYWPLDAARRRARRQCPQRHRLPLSNQAPAGHRQMLAQDVRDRAHSRTAGPAATVSLHHRSRLPQDNRKVV